MPLAWLHAAGAALGWIAYGLSPAYRERVRLNAALARVDSCTVRQSVAEAGRMSMETVWLWFRPAERALAAWVRWEGPPLIEQALQAGRGLLLLTPHMGSFEVAARAYAERFGHERPITVLYRPAHRTWLAGLQARARVRPGLQVAPASLSGVRRLLRALKQGQTVGLLPDQVPPQGQGVWAPFFGVKAYTMTLAARLARQSGAALVTVWCERLPKGAGFVIHQRALPTELAAAIAGDDEAAAAAVNRAMEALIAESPGQYLWGYNRYKPPRAVAPALDGAAA